MVKKKKITTDYKRRTCKNKQNFPRSANHDKPPLLSADLTVVKFSTVVNSPGSRQESSRVSSCSCHDQSTGRRYPVKYRSDGYETSVQEGPELILRLLTRRSKVSYSNQGMRGKEPGGKGRRQVNKQHMIRTQQMLTDLLGCCQR